MPTRNTMSSLRDTLFTIVLAIAAIVLVPTSPAPAQADPLAPPQPAVSMDAYHQVERWVRLWGTPLEPERDLDPPGTHAVCVTLRLDGLVIGRGKVHDGKHKLLNAARLALEQADPLLPIDYSHDRAEQAQEVARDIIVQLELAGPLIPLLGDTLEVVALEVGPHRDGVAIRSGRSLALTFPTEQRQRNIGPARALRVAMGELDLPPIRLGQLRDSHAVVPYRFNITEIAQIETAGPAIFIHRGGKTVPQSDVNAPALREAADSIVDHLARRRWPGDERYGLLGTYLIPAGSHDPIPADPADQAVTAFALARYANRAPWISDDRGAETLALARNILLDLTVLETEEKDPLNDVVAAAAWLIAAGECSLIDLEPDEASRAFAAQARELVLTTPVDLANWPPDIPSTGRALVALAIAELARAAPQNTQLAKQARETVRTVYAETQPGNLAAAMPWLGLAELSVTETGRPIPSFIALLRMRELMWQYQVSAQDTGFSDRDLEGGVVFTQSTTPLPSWHMLRPLAFTAVMLADERLTEQSAYTTELAALTKALRFLLQLTVREPELHMARDPQRARGAVRLALWDQRSSVQANALALFTLVEILAAVEDRGRPRPVQTPTRQSGQRQAEPQDSPAGNNPKNPGTPPTRRGVQR